jgi:hypothetical protein
LFIEPVHNEDLPQSEKNKAFNFFVLFAYGAVAITGIFFHPLWRDEFHTWSIAGTSSSLRELLQMTLRETIRTIATVWKAWFPVPNLNMHFWNTNIVKIEIIQAILSLVLVFSAGLFFIKRPAIFFLYLTRIYAFTVQLFVPFSAVRMTAGYIQQQKLDRFLIAGDEDKALEPVLGYLNKEVFFFSRNAFSSYLIYDHTRKIPTRSTLLVMADSLVKMHGDTILLVMNYPLKVHPGLDLRKVRSFEKSICYDEIYYLYLLCPLENKSTSLFEGEQ